MRTLKRFLRLREQRLGPPRFDLPWVGGPRSAHGTGQPGSLTARAITTLCSLRELTSCASTYGVNCAPFTDTT